MVCKSVNLLPLSSYASLPWGTVTVTKLQRVSPAV